MQKRIFNQEKTQEIVEPDLSLGYLQDDTLFIAHHDAVEALEEIAHYDKKSLPNGAISYMRVVDRKGVSACEAYDEYEDIYVFIPYTAAELVARQQGELRKRREAECFPIINRGILWYEKLTTEQKTELSVWYEAWLNAPQTLSAPETPSWLVDGVKTE